MTVVKWTPPKASRDGANGARRELNRTTCYVVSVESDFGTRECVDISAANHRRCNREMTVVLPSVL